MFFNNSALLEVRENIQLTLLPVVIIVVIYMIFGIFGNILVINYYGFVQKQNPSFMFIVSMAASDLTVCVLSMPLEIVDMMEFYTFPSVAACKILRFVNYFVCLFSVLCLLWIAVDRYKKFCKPFKIQMSVINAKKIIALSLAVAMVVACPNFIFYDIVPVNITHTYEILTSNANTSGYNDGVVGYDCKTHEYYRLFVSVYHGSLFLLFLVIVFSLVILYFHVVRRMLSMDNFREEQNMTIHSISKFGQKESVDCIIDGSKNDRKDENIYKFHRNKNKSAKYHMTATWSVNPDKSNKKDNNSNAVERINLKEKTTDQETNQPNCTNNEQFNLEDKTEDKKTSEEKDKNTDIEKLHIQIKTKENSTPKPKHQENHVYTKRFTKITLSVTVAFVVSFLPYLGLMAWQTLYTDYQRLSGARLLIYNLFIRSWLLNSVVNPIIYGFLNRHFRQYVICSFKKRTCFTKCRSSK